MALQSGAHDPVFHYDKEELLSILNSAGEGIYGVDLAGNCTFCNPECLSLLGFEKADQLIGRNMHDLIHHKRADGTSCPSEECPILLASQQGSKLHDDDSVLFRSDGTAFPAELRSYPQSKGGEIIGTVVTFSDITQRKEADNQLKQAIEREKELANIVREAPLAIAYGYPDGRLANCNDAFSDLTGYSLAELQEIKWNDVLTPTQWLSSEWDKLKQLNPDNRRVQYEKEYIHKDGTVIPIELTVTAKFNPAGEIINFVGFISDITERKQAEATIHESHAILQAAMDCSPAGIAIADAPDGTLRYVNDAGLLIRGDRRESIVNGVDSNQYVSKWQLLDLDLKPLDPEEVPLARAVLFGEESNRDFVIRDADEVDHIVAAKAAPIKEKSGKTVAGVVVFNEITERIKAEQERQALEKQLHQKHKMEAVGYMAGGMAHNFNNNLSIILGNLDLALMNLASDPDTAHLLGNAKTAVLRSRDLIRKIITYSRKGVQDKSTARLKDIIDETIGLITSTMPSSINIIRNDCEEDTEITINADPSQIQETLINLCNNAVQAMDEQGNLTINLAAVKLKKADIPAMYEARPGLYAKLGIGDTGCGINPDVLDKIFDPFYTTKEAYEGAGMGLATVQGIVAQHNGLIKVESTPEKGTTFNLFFPIVSSGHDETASQGPIQEAYGGSETILYVDDDPMLIELSKRILTPKGYTVAALTDSTEALKLFSASAEEIDLVITDQTMPNLTGQELIQQIRQIKPDIPVILCTGYSSKVDEELAKTQGINAFLMKPIDTPYLPETVRRVLDGENG